MKKSACAGHPARADLKPGSYPDEQVRKQPVKVSRNGRRRALVLILVHVAIFAHILHWQLAGETLAPLEPSEAMYTIATGVVNAGAIVMALSLLSTLLLGRFFCGWACHLVALQDLCATLLRRIGIRPRPLRSRWLVVVPLLAGIHMFFWPLFLRKSQNLPAPPLDFEFQKASFWETFPGFWVGALTFLVCGFLMIYLLGAKGFCTYACPYGGLFGVLDRFSPGRIVVNDDCKRCGHCTAVCTSNVLVHKEVHEYGSVVDPGCMKCMDCVSACPENALSFGFTKPAAFRKPKRKEARITPQFRYGEEIAMAIIFAVTMLVLRGLPQGIGTILGSIGLLSTGPGSAADSLDRLSGATSSLYGVLPSLFALGLAAINAFGLVFLWRLFARAEVLFQGRALRTSGRLTKAGRIALVALFLWLGLFLQSTAVQVLSFLVRQDVEATAPISSAIAKQDAAVLDALDAEMKARIERIDARAHLAAKIGFTLSPELARDLVYVAMARRDLKEAERLLEELQERFPTWGNHYAIRGDVLALQGRYDEAVLAYEEAAARRTSGGANADAISRGLEKSILQQVPETVLGLARAIVARNSPDAAAQLQAIGILSDAGFHEEALLASNAERFAQFDLAPRNTARVLQAKVLARLGRHKEAEAAFEALARDYPDNLEFHFAVAEQLWLGGDREGGLKRAEALAERFPNEAKPLQLVSAMLMELGRRDESQRALRRAQELMKGRQAEAQ